MPKRKKVLIIVTATLCALAALAFGAYKVMNARTFQLFGEIVSRVETDEKVVALTFDDGPTDYTPGILEILDELDVKATFFLTGSAMEDNMEYAKAIAGAGHQIGNHSYSHERMIFKSREFIENEIDSTNALIREAGYEGTIVFRPPNCKKLILLPLVLNERDMVTVTCDVEPDSYKEVASSAEAISDYVAGHAASGSIILLHIMYDSGENARDAVPDIVTRLREQGYTFVTVNELLTLE
ncbi:MAG: polysaccharide deacetylase family protein [Eubacteriales bacterium]|nr:polysaccharide deacetylase family protein [Eubacteriales bacterium]